MQQPIYSVASRKILEIQVLRPFFKAFLSRIQVFYYFSSIFLFFTKGCGKCRCSIMGLVYLVVRKWMMEIVFLLTTTLLFQYFSIITHPALWAPLLLEGNVCDAPKVREFRRVGMFLVVGLILCSEVGRLRRAGKKMVSYYSYVPQEHQVCRLKITCNFKHRRCGRFSIFLDNPKARKFRRVCFLLKDYCGKLID